MSKHFPTCVARLYRRDALAENQPDFGDNLVNSYPTGLRWFLFLLSAAVPYMVVRQPHPFYYPFEIIAD